MTTRRGFLFSGAAVAATGALRPLLGNGGQRADAATLAAGAARQLPTPASSGIDHIVVLCMENRSFDHILGWLPGANGKQAGLSYRDSKGTAHQTYHLTTFQGCGHPDPDHSYQGARVEYDNGKCDGWLLVNDEFAIGYYRQSDLPFLGRAAPAWTVCDNYFAPTAGPTFPNRLYLHAAQTDRLDDSISLTSLPTIWDRLAAGGVSHAYYYNDLPFLSLWGLKYLGISRSWGRFLADAAAGTLPAVSYLDPPFFLEAVDGTSADDHPHGDIRNGEHFMNTVYQAVTRGRGWARTLLVITFDEWGGFFDHVAPRAAPDARPAVTGLRGFRVPCLVISPRARRGAVAHGLFDHTSVLKLIEWRFGLPPLTPRDAAANNLANALDFTAPPVLTAPQWHVGSVFALPCLVQGLIATGGPAAGAPRRLNGDGPGWAGLHHAAVAGGWRLRR
jgi:phospholipase C